MEKLNSMPKFTARLSREPHNVSQSFAFTCSTGMLLPVYQDVLHPDDTVYLNDKFFARINNPVTAALGQIDFHLDWFFVPATMIFTPFGSMMYDTNDLVSSSLVSLQTGSAVSSPNHDHFPHFNLDNLFQYLSTVDKDWYTKNLGYSENQPQLAFPYFGCAGNNIFRLLNHLEYNPYEVFNRIPSTDDVPNPHFGVARNPASFPWSLATYQCIYQHYFRNDDREPKEYFSWQLDSFWGLDSFPTPPPYINNHNLSKYIVQLRFANCYKDYFTSVKVSPIQSSVSNLFNSGDAQYDYLAKIDNWLGSPDRFLPSDVMGDQTSVDGSVTQVALQDSHAKLSSSNIRSVFALEKLLRIVGRADKNYESQVLAHFGFKIPHDVLHNITHIGHDMATMELSPILSTANTFNGDTGSGLGEVGGNGVISFSGRRRQFKAPCHGFLMCIMHCKPRYRYFGTFSKLNMISTRLDFYQPEFDKLGMQPLFAYEANGMRINQASQSYRYGWQYRYEQFKRKYNRVSEAFATSHAYTDSSVQHPMVNSWSPWVIAKRPFDNVNADVDTGVYWNSFLSTAIDLDSILQVPYNPYWSNDFLINPHLIFQTDPFICDFTADVKKVNSMSEYGEPDL